MTDLLNTITPQLSSINSTMNAWESLNDDLSLEELQKLDKEVNDPKLKDAIATRMTDIRQKHKINALLAKGT